MHDFWCEHVGYPGRPVEDGRYIDTIKRPLLTAEMLDKLLKRLRVFFGILSYLLVGGDEDTVVGISLTSLRSLLFGCTGRMIISWNTSTSFRISSRGIITY